MTEQNSTPTEPQNQGKNNNGALNLRWKYFKSIGGELLVKQFATNSLASNPNFESITQDEYEFMVSEMQS